jgi:hypothetical protein
MILSAIILFGGAIWANGHRLAGRKLKKKLTDQAHAFERSVFIIILNHFICFENPELYCKSNQ